MDAGLMEKGDWPKYVDAIRPIYEPEELTAMFKVATEDEADMLKFILGSGFRDQEIRYVEYLDLDFRHQIVRVTAKAKWGFTPKNWEERTVPLPAGLIERLRKRKERKARGRTILSSAIRRASPTARWIWSSSASRSAPV
jgi:integrase/recombinase XerD